MPSSSTGWRRSLGAAALVVCALAAAAPAASEALARAGAHAADTEARLLPVRVVVAGARNPVQAVASPDGRSDVLYVVEQGGRVRVAVGGRLQPVPFLDLRPAVGHGGLRGLLSLAFHPRYAANRLVVATYVTPRGVVVVASFRVRDGVARVASRRVLMRVPTGAGAYGHFGGLARFGPDGLLYVGLGDGGVPARAQDPASALGKIVRLRVDAPRTSVEIVASGLRNPWRFSFAPLSGALVIGDVGAERWEEIDVVPRIRFGDANLGWPAFEGPAPSADWTEPLAGRVLPPIAAYRHRGTRCWSVTGGVVYRGALHPRLRGRYVFGDLCGGMWSTRLTGPSQGRLRPEPLAATGILTSIDLDAQGELLLVGGDGRIVTPLSR